ncbi:MAG: stage III sporulation protein AA [Ruminococcaceae bacterium]|nr:stage III sporulation protein AA [Oscillospiraceae bacterium]
MTSGYLSAFLGAAAALGEEAHNVLGAVSEQDMALAAEIRLRVGARAVLSLPDGLRTVGTDPVTRRQMDSMILALCGNSVYTHQHEMASGFISLPGGHRAGVCGRAVVKDGIVTAVRDVSTICLRIAREHRGCADALVDGLFSHGLCSAIIAGAPSSGKTTLLRDAACALAEGRTGSRQRIAVVDERGELAVGDGSRISSLCDVLSGYPKAEGIMTALRCLSPDVIVCDEVGGEGDVRAIQSGINSGVHFLCSVHAGSVAEVGRRQQIAALLGTGAFRRIALLTGRTAPGRISRIIDSEEVYEDTGSGAHRGVLRTGGDVRHGQAAAQKSSA